MKKVLTATLLITIFIGISLSFTATPLSAAQKEYPDRGRYIYDEAGRLTVESTLSLSSYLWQIDSKTDYEIVIVSPKEKFSDKEIIDWFNKQGVGKEGLDNGTAIFVFPDNSWFVSLGSGNDKIGVPYAKTYGEKILKNLEDDLVLSLLRYVDSLNQEIETAIPKTKGASFGEKVLDNFPIILLWLIVVSLGVFLYQQRDGFQKRDLIIPILLLAIFGIFMGVSILSASGKFESYTDYGVITSTKLDTRHWVQVVSTGKTTTTIPHTDYINYTDILNYGLKSGNYKFVSTDDKGAWKYQIGDFVKLKVDAQTGRIEGAHGIDDLSGGKTIGDGVWGGS